MLSFVNNFLIRFSTGFVRLWTKYFLIMPLQQSNLPLSYLSMRCVKDSNFVLPICSRVHTPCLPTHLKVDKVRIELTLLRLQHSTLPLSYLSKKIYLKIRSDLHSYNNAVSSNTSFAENIIPHFCGRTDEAFTPCCLASSSLNRLSNSPFFLRRESDSNA